MPESLPLSVRLECPPAAPSPAVQDFSGQDIVSAEALPQRLLGCPFSPGSFEVGRAGGWMRLGSRETAASWSARWEGPSGGGHVEASWKREEGWRISARWGGMPLAGASAPADASFLAALGPVLASLPEGIGSVLRTGHSLSVFRNRKRARLDAADGAFVILHIPLAAGLVGRAAGLAASLPEAVRGFPVGMRLFLCRCSHRRDAAVPGPADFAARDEALSASGLPPASEPRAARDRWHYRRCVYLLKITAPYHLVPLLLGHFAPAVSSGRYMKPFAAFALDQAEHSEFVMKPAQGEDETWDTGPEWMRKVDAAPAVDPAEAVPLIERAAGIAPEPPAAQEPAEEPAARAPEAAAPPGAAPAFAPSVVWAAEGAAPDLRGAGDLPTCIELNRAGADPDPEPCSFSGDEVDSPAMLPERLLGAELDPALFSSGGKCGMWDDLIDDDDARSWSASWTGGGSVSLRWNSLLGWRLLVSLPGGGSAAFFAPAPVTFFEMFEGIWKEMPAGLARGLAGLPLDFAAPSPGEPLYAPPPDGPFIDLAIPLRASCLGSAAGLFYALRSKNLPSRVDGRIFLARCRVSGIASEKEAEDAAAGLLAASGVPLSGSPAPSDGAWSLWQDFYVLRLTLPWHSVSRVLGHFEACAAARTAPAARPFAASAVSSRLAAGIRTAPGVYWEFPGSWRGSFTESEPAEAAGAIAAAGRVIPVAGAAPKTIARRAAPRSARRREEFAGCTAGRLDSWTRY